MGDRIQKPHHNYVVYGYRTAQCLQPVTSTYDNGAAHRRNAPVVRYAETRNDADRIALALVEGGGCLSATYEEIT